MSILVVGLSHRSAPVEVLEAATVPSHDLAGLLARATSASHLGEAVALSTCNRVELYAVVDRFHGGVDEVTALLADQAGLALDDLTPSLYVHYDEGAVQHLFSVVCGLDSMVVGEGQILGQVRTALRAAQQTGSAGTLLNELFQNALRVGKRAHAETEIDRAGSALVTVGFDRAAEALGGLTGRHVLVVGAGSMAGIVTAALSGRGVAHVTIANRTLDRGTRLAASSGGSAIDLSAVGEELVRADLVVSCTGATGHVLDWSAVGPAHAARSGRPLAFLDLAMPRDVDPRVSDLAGVTVVSLDDLGLLLSDAQHVADIDAVRRIAAEEVTAYVVAQRAARVAPTVVALRQLASDVVAAELARLDIRLPDLDPAARTEVEQTVRRTVDKLLHAPTVRMKELAADEGGQAYAEALHRLFDLDPEAVDLVARADVGGPTP